MVSSPTLIGTPPCSGMTFESDALAGNLGLGALRPLDGGAPERARRIGLALGQLDIVRRDSVAHNKSLQPPRTIDDGDRHPRGAFGPRRFRDRQRHARRHLPLHQHLRVDGAWNGQNCRYAGRGQHPKHHEFLPTVVTLEFHLRPALRRRPMPGLCHGPHALVTGANSAGFRQPGARSTTEAVVGHPGYRTVGLALPSRAPSTTPAEWRGPAHRRRPCTMPTAIPRAIG